MNKKLILSAVIFIFFESNVWSNNDLQNLHERMTQNNKGNEHPSTIISPPISKPPSAKNGVHEEQVIKKIKKLVEYTSFLEKIHADDEIKNFLKEKKEERGHLIQEKILPKLQHMSNKSIATLLNAENDMKSEVKEKYITALQDNLNSQENLSTTRVFNNYADYVEEKESKNEISDAARKYSKDTNEAKNYCELMKVFKNSKLSEKIKKEAQTVYDVCLNWQKSFDEDHLDPDVEYIKLLAAHAQMLKTEYEEKLELKIDQSKFVVKNSIPNVEDNKSVLSLFEKMCHGMNRLSNFSCGDNEGSQLREHLSKRNAEIIQASPQKESDKKENLAASSLSKSEELIHPPVVAQSSEISSLEILKSFQELIPIYNGYHPIQNKNELEHYLTSPDYKRHSQSAKVYYNREEMSFHDAEKALRCREPVNIEMNTHHDHQKWMEFGKKHGGFCEGGSVYGNATTPNHLIQKKENNQPFKDLPNTVSVYSETNLWSRPGEADSKKEIACLSIPAPALDSKKQPHYHYYFDSNNGQLNTEKYKKEMAHLANTIVQAALDNQDTAFQGKKIKRLVIPFYGQAAFLAEVPDDQKPHARQKFAETLRDAIYTAKSNGSLKISVKLSTFDMKEVQNFPETSIDELCIALGYNGKKDINCFIEGDILQTASEHDLIVNAWDPHSLPGNGNDKDRSFDGAMGKGTGILLTQSTIFNKNLAHNSAKWIGLSKQISQVSNLSLPKDLNPSQSQSLKKFIDHFGERLEKFEIRRKNYDSNTKLSSGPIEVITLKFKNDSHLPNLTNYINSIAGEFVIEKGVAVDGNNYFHLNPKMFEQ